MSFGETVFLFVLALVVFGPKKLPEIARQVGRYLAEFRRASNEFKSQIEQEIAHLEVQERQKILPPTPPPDGTASRSLTPAASEVAANTTEPAATSITTDSATATNTASATAGAEVVAAPSTDTPTPSAEALASTEPVTAAQDSHA